MIEQGLFYPDGSYKSREELMADLTPKIDRGTLYLYNESTDLLKEAQKLGREHSMDDKEATWEVKLDKPDMPLGILMATDIHYGSIRTNYELLDRHLTLVENTPNLTLITNGDHVDNFNITGKWATGVFEDPLPPQIQTKAFIEKIKHLDSMDKLGVMSFGNHEDMMGATGYDWFESFAQGMKAAVFKTGGFLHILVGEQHYGLALTHRYWGTSKLNPTNAAKRFWEHEYPQAEIVFLGHTHQSEVLTWERGGRERIAVIGGTYKEDDEFARKHGIGGRSGMPGITILLYPHEHRMVALKDIEVAAEFLRR